MDELNQQLQRLTEEYTNKQEIQAIRDRLISDPELNRVNSKMHELRAYNPFAELQAMNNQHHIQNQHNTAAHPSRQDSIIVQHQGPSTIPYRLNSGHENLTADMNSRANGSGLGLKISGPNMRQAEDTCNSIGVSNQHSRNDKSAPHGTDKSQLGDFRSSIGVYDKSTPHGTREAMNERMDRFRFDNTTFQRGSLVPINMNHIYSGNLFEEGNPIPEDLRNEYVPGYRPPGSRVHYQEKSKTIYRDEFNERLSALSPLSRTLYFPNAEELQQQQLSYNVDPGLQGQGLSNTAKSQLIVHPEGVRLGDFGSSIGGSERPPWYDKSAPHGNTRRQELSQRMSQYQPLAAASSLPPTTNQQQKNVAYNHMYPVSSK
jgi:hypothetical protein